MLEYKTCVENTLWHRILCCLYCLHCLCRLLWKVHAHILMSFMPFASLVSAKFILSCLCLHNFWQVFYWCHLYPSGYAVRGYVGRTSFVFFSDQQQWITMMLNLLRDSMAWSCRLSPFATFRPTIPRLAPKIGFFAATMDSFADCTIILPVLFPLDSSFTLLAFLLGCNIVRPCHAPIFCARSIKNIQSRRQIRSANRRPRPQSEMRVITAGVKTLLISAALTVAGETARLRTQNR